MNKYQLISKTIGRFCKVDPPIDFIEQLHGIEDNQAYLQLQDWIMVNILKDFRWCTSEGIIEAAYDIYHGAIDNGNIKP